MASTHGSTTLTLLSLLDHLVAALKVHDLRLRALEQLADRLPDVLDPDRRLRGSGHQKLLVDAAQVLHHRLDPAFEVLVIVHHHGDQPGQPLEAGDRLTLQHLDATDRDEELAQQLVTMVQALAEPGHHVLQVLPDLHVPSLGRHVPLVQLDDPLRQLLHPVLAAERLPPHRLDPATPGQPVVDHPHHEPFRGRVPQTLWARRVTSCRAHRLFLSAAPCASCRPPPRAGCAPGCRPGPRPTAPRPPKPTSVEPSSTWPSWACRS